MPWRRMNRSSTSGPPWSGAGAPRTCSGRDDGFVTADIDVILVPPDDAHAWRVNELLRRPRLRRRYDPAPMADKDSPLAERLLAGDKRALARGISLVEDDDPEGWALVREIYPHTGSAS